MARLCPRCGGTEVGCPVCDMTPKRSVPLELPSRLAALNIVESDVEWAVQGVDISSWNGTMDFGILKTKCQYGYIRVGYNNYGKDPRCDFNRQVAIANDFPYGVYWYCKPGLDWKQHADNFAEVAAEYPYQLDMVVDVETTLLNPSDTLVWLINLDSRLTYLTGKKVMIYTSAGFWDSGVAHSNHFTNHRLWVANWTLGNSPWLPNDWISYLHWQWSADGNRKGPEYGSGPDGDADMDLDRYHGSVVEFNTLYGTHIMPIGDTPPPPPPPIPARVRVNVANLTVRSAPVVTPTTVLGYTTYGKIWEVEDIAHDASGNLWWQVGQAVYLAGYKWNGILMTVPV